MPVTWLEQRWAGERGSQWARRDFGKVGGGESAGGRDGREVKEVMGFAAKSGKEEVQRLVETARREAQEAEAEVEKEGEKGDVQQYGRMQVVS